MTRDRPHRRDELAIAAIFVVGLALSVLLALRAQVGGDQLNLLARGWLLVARGEWVPYGNPSSNGGAVPGGLTALLVGGPLLVWRDHRAPVLGVLVAQAAAFLLLDRFARQTVGRQGRLLFAVVYWLNPWRFVLSGFLWNPGYTLLVGAAHAWSCFRQRDHGRFGASFALAAALGLGLQINLSVALLGMATLALLLSGHVKLRWVGVAAGAVVAALPLVPWLAVVGQGASGVEITKGLGRGLLLGFPLVRGVSYWLRHASLLVSGKESRFDFSLALDAGSAWLPRLLGDVLVKGAGALSLLLVVMANVWLWRRLGRGRGRRIGWRGLVGPGGTRRSWALSYARICFLAAMVVYALDPLTVMWWDGIPLLHAAVLPLALWGAALWRRRPREVRIGVTAWGTAAVAIALLLAFGGPRHRCGGRSSIVIPLRHDHPMLHDLGIHDSCPVPIEPDGWWPDVLAEPDGTRRR